MVQLAGSLCLLDVCLHIEDRKVARRWSIAGAYFA